MGLKIHQGHRTGIDWLAQEFLAQMGEAARTRARRLYSVDAMCEATLAVYNRVLEARGLTVGRG